ncbi:serine hydrolase domain-containing protein [Planosporangium sp. 12N6]|uniref:serine hydrolase domain-containing protein n=1 Tax=Planosporangium spinosum TaxID=3402278 RepID=UPI003CF8F47D
MTKPSLLPSLGRELAALAREHGVPGAQLAIHQDGRTVTAEVGELASGTGRPVTTDTAFAIGSITKTFTATTTMVLADDGDVDLDACVGEYLSGLADLGDQATLRHLLSHTSGLADGPDPREVPDSALHRYVKEHCLGRNLVFRPGAGFSYSNLGYVLVGRIIETVTGMSWREAVESIVLRPLGITPAFVDGTAPRAPGRPVAVGHSVNARIGRIRPVHPSLTPAHAATGALAMSATDLVALAGLHLGAGVPALLPAEYAARMRSAVPGADPFGLADGWGLGLAVYREADTTWVGHDGNINGVSSYLRIDPAGGRVVALTANANSGAALWQELRSHLDDLGIPLARARRHAPLRISTAPPAGCAGAYTNGDVEHLVVDKEDGNVYLSVDGGGLERLTFYDELTFTIEDPTTGREVLGGRFLRDPATGEIDALQMGGRRTRRRATTYAVRVA